MTRSENARKNVETSGGARCAVRRRVQINTLREQPAETETEMVDSVSRRFDHVKRKPTARCFDLV